MHIVDIESNSYRDSTLKDLHNPARITDQKDNVHFFQRPMVAKDMESTLDPDISTLYASLAGTSKHVGTSVTVPENAAPLLEMLYMEAGGEAAFRARLFVSASICFVAPLRFARDACEVMESLVKGGVPILLLSAGQAGAEVLAGLVYVNAISPGHPAIFGTWPFVSDLRTGAMSGGAGEQALLSAAVSQMARFYDLPAGSAAGQSPRYSGWLRKGHHHRAGGAFGPEYGLRIRWHARLADGVLL